MQLIDLCHIFLNTCKVTRKLSNHTIRAYTKDLSILRHYVGNEINIKDIDRNVINNFVRQLCETDASISSNKRRIACVKSMFRWMELEDYIDVNPFHKIELKLKIPRKLPRNIPSEELSILIQKARSDFGLSKHQRYTENNIRLLVKSKKDLNKLSTIVVMELLISTGLRVGELISIKEVHIFWQEGRIRILGKGQRERYVFLPDPELIKLIQSYIKVKSITTPDNDYLLVNSRGKLASTQFIRKLVKNLSQKTNIDRNITPHMYRHSAACQLLESGVDIRFVQRLLGHHSIMTTEIYTYVNDRVLQDKITRAGVRMEIS